VRAQVVVGGVLFRHFAHPSTDWYLGRRRSAKARLAIDPMQFELDDEAYLRRSFEVARRAFANGSHPFGALLVSHDAQILLERENGFLPDRDLTAHAERLLATAASRSYDPAFLARCTMYASAEPCAMCAGAAYWAGIGRVVYALSERRLKAIIGDHVENPTLDLPCRMVFAAGQRPVEVLGPLLEDEAAAIHLGAWPRRTD
jgi:tRNA(Arg) A34 adenosine deaminase TadA